MEVINATPFTVGTVLGRIPYPGHSLTLIVKGTFDLKSGQPATISEDQLYPTGDEAYPDDEEGTGSLRYESDFACHKPRTDLLLVGRCQPPVGTPVTACRVTFGVGPVRKSLAVVGERFLEPGVLGSRLVGPQPFEQLDLRYENSYGGPDYAPNPVGKGHGTQKLPDGRSVHVLPNIQSPDAPVEAGDKHPALCGFGPLSRTWHDRHQRLGSYRGDYLHKRWPWFSEGFDATYFNAAPLDQQVEGYLHGDESLYFEHLIPGQARLQAALPGLQVRCFVSEHERAGGRFRPVQMRLDTLWVDAEAARLVLVWRGWCQVCDPDYDEIAHWFILSEPAGQPEQGQDAYRARFLAALEEEERQWAFEPELPEPAPFAAEPEPTPEELAVEQEIAAAEEKMRADLAAAGIDPDNPPPPSEEEKALLAELGITDEPEDEPWTRERINRAAREKQSLAGEDLSGLDLAAVALPGVDLGQALLAGAGLEKADLSGASLPRANLAGAKLAGAKLAGADLTEADLTGADLTGADLTGAILTGAVLEKADLGKARLDRAQAGDANFNQACLTEASLVESRLCGADFSECDLTRADLTGADLSEASLKDVKAAGVNMQRAVLTRLRASGNGDFTAGLFQEVSGDESIWENAMLARADFSHASLAGANFTAARLDEAVLRAAELKGARLPKASLRGARLVQANLFEASLERADLTGADFAAANLYAVEFLDALVDRTRFDGANLKKTKLAMKPVVGVRMA